MLLHLFLFFRKENTGVVRIRSPTKFNSFKYGDRNFYHLFILERKVEMKEERLKIKGNLVDEVKSHVFIGKNSEVKVYNFILVKKYGKGKEYINCSFYGNKIDKLKKGDLVYIFGSFSERRKEDKIYKNFIVKEVKKI